MSEWVNEKNIQEGKNPTKPFGLPYLAHIEYAEKVIKDHAIKRAKINDKKHKPTKPQKERKTIHWLEVEI